MSPRSTTSIRPAAATRAEDGHVTEIQRSRMLTAAIAAVEEVGYSRMTVAQVINRARVSRKTFYDVFSDREDCFLAAFDETVARARRAVREAYHGQTDWAKGTRAALVRLLQLMEEEPGAARVCVVEALAAGPAVLERRAAVMEEMARSVDRGGRANLAAGSRPSAVTAEGTIGAIASVLHSRLLESPGQPLVGLLGPLMSMIVLPYQGPKAAERELQAAAPDPLAVNGRRRGRASGGDPLQGLNMRLTYRTVRVLMVIADFPGASNREIAEGSGIVDQGQISKLLTRLARLALIENRGEGQERGAANAWHLTPRGLAVERATRPR